MNWQALISFRVIAVSLLAGGLVAMLLQDAVGESTATTIGAVVFVGVWLVAAMNSELVLSCPYCRKRVKLGATTCHHCGRDVRSQPSP